MIEKSIAPVKSKRCVCSSTLLANIWSSPDTHMHMHMHSAIAIASSHLLVARIQGVRANGWCGCHGYPNDAKLLGCDDGWKIGGGGGSPVDGTTVLPLAARWTDQL